MDLQQLKAENAELRKLLLEGVEIAKAFKKETGMVWGERIGVFVAQAEGTHFNAREYNFERLPGEQ